MLFQCVVNHGQLKVLADNQKWLYGCPWDSQFLFLNSDTACNRTKHDQGTQLHFHIIRYFKGHKNKLRNMKKYLLVTWHNLLGFINA